MSLKDYVPFFEVKAPIIKKGLEMYANDIILTDADLWRYWDKEGLRTNAHGASKLQRTFVEKTMQLHRIIFYAGYVIYPDWGINELIEGQHEGIISLSVANDIIQKQQARHTGKTGFKGISHKMTDENPLKGVITCSGCKRKFTSWNTTKLVGKKGHKKKEKYPYYGCNNKDCTEKLNVKKDKLEQEFKEFLEQMKLPSGVLNLIDAMFLEAWNQYKHHQHKLKRNNADLLKSYEVRQSEIEASLPKISNVKLSQKMEEERATLDAKIVILQEDMEEDKLTDVRFKALLGKVKHLFQDPSALWNLGNPTMRGLLITVRFGDNLTYTKKEGLKTIGKGTLYSIFSSLKENISANWASWDSNPGPPA